MQPITRRQFLKRTIQFSALGLAASYPLFIERNIVVTNHYRIPVPNLPNSFSGFRVVHLTDFHYGDLVSLNFIRDIVERSLRLKPDLIVCTGDYVHEKKSTHQIDEVWPILAALTAPYGVYSVLGNHDHWADVARSDYWLKKTGQDLRHKSVRIERDNRHFWLAGAGDFYEDRRNLDIVLAPIPEADCRIVLAHNPDTADTKYNSRIDLMLSGHTHGGQVILPFIGPPILPVRNKNYSSGLKTSPRGCKVFISKGIGWANFPVRFNCYPEIAVLELAPD
ncbi:MAG: metallophosphoesterase [Desulfobacteraceae bacterium]|nr:MAG: metallophosphoesterase [Desulfobacteraceae bacterium]